MKYSDSTELTEQQRKQPAEAVLGVARSTGGSSALWSFLSCAGDTVEGPGSQARGSHEIGSEHSTALPLEGTQVVLGSPSQSPET